MKMCGRYLMFCYSFFGLFCLAFGSKKEDYDGNIKRPRKPHIIMILADDMGFDDISLHGSNQIPTPNIDALGLFGVTLNNYYVGPMCTPSRSSLMTGKYQSNLGMNHFVIASPQPYGLSRKEKILPQYLKEAGYGTHLIGKWHLGFHKRSYTPTQRGFDSHFGYVGPYIDYYNHSLTFERLNLANGYDMRKNLSVHWDTKGEYATNLFTRKAVETIENHNENKPLFLLVSHLAPHTGNSYEELQAPEDEIKKFLYIKDKKRRLYAAIVSLLDKSVGKIVRALKEKDMLDNSVILFMSDNGSPIQGEHSNSGSNYPFKGQKDSPWEGALRSAAVIWSPLLNCRQRISNQLTHITDWLPTFAKLAGVEVPNNLDGKNIWPTLSHDQQSPRKELLCHYDPLDPPYKAYIKGDFKYLFGTTYNGTYDKWLSDDFHLFGQNVRFARYYSNYVLESDVGNALLPYSRSYNDSRSHMKPAEIQRLRRKARIDCNGQRRPSENDSFYCNPFKKPCLFNITQDPCETTNIAELFPQIVKRLEADLHYYEKIAQPPRNKPADICSDPSRFNNTWTWWLEEDGSTGSVSQIKYSLLVLISYSITLIVF